MKHVAVLAALLLCSGVQAGELKLSLQGEGFGGTNLYVAVYSSAADFLVHDDKAIRKVVVANRNVTELSIQDLPAGEYAVAAFADVNGNGKLDSNFLGVPKEPAGMSRDAKGEFGPPKFADAVFKVGEGVTSQTIHIK
jgi:uncharacterized protein (DUF2141 family)